MHFSHVEIKRGDTKIPAGGTSSFSVALPILKARKIVLEKLGSRQQLLFHTIISRNCSLWKWQRRSQKELDTRGAIYLEDEGHKPGWSFAVKKSVQEEAVLLPHTRRRERKDPHVRLLSGPPRFGKAVAYKLEGQLVGNRVYDRRCCTQSCVYPNGREEDCMTTNVLHCMSCESCEQGHIRETGNLFVSDQGAFNRPLGTLWVQCEQHWTNGCLKALLRSTSSMLFRAQQKEAFHIFL